MNNEFDDIKLKKSNIYQECYINFKDPEVSKSLIREKYKSFDYISNEVDFGHKEVDYGEGPLFKKVDSKIYTLTLKGLHSHKKSKKAGFIIILVSIILFMGFVSLANFTHTDGFVFFGFVVCFFILSFGYKLLKPLKILTKITGVAHRVRGEEILSDQKIQIGGQYGSKMFGRGVSLKKDYEKFSQELIEYFGKATPSSEKMYE